MRTGISNVVSASLLILIGLSLGSLLFSQLSSSMRSMEAGLTDILLRSAHSAGKKLTLLYLHSNSTHTVFLVYNYGWRDLEVRALLINGSEMDFHLYVLEESSGIWVEGPLLKAGHIAEIIVPSVVLPGELVIMDSENSIVRVE